jgi:hypothetical protein
MAVAKALSTSVDYLRTGKGEAPSNSPPLSGVNAEKVREGIRELEKLPAVAAYRALIASL